MANNRSRLIDQIIMGGVGVLLGFVSWSFNSLYSEILSRLKEIQQQININSEFSHSNDKRISIIETILNNSEYREQK